MALTVNTNLSSLIAQRNLKNATNALDTSIERMTTGFKINHAKDNAAGFSIASNWETQISSIDIASSNAAMGKDLLTTAEENYSLLTKHLQRIRDLVEQAANGTYGTDSLKAIKTEISTRISEIARISANTDYNGIQLMNGRTTPIKLQIGIKSDTNSTITLANTLFGKADLPTLSTNASIATTISGWTTASTNIASTLNDIDKAIATVSDRVTQIGAAQNSIDSAISALDVQSQNLTSSLSTIRDADVAAESSAYIKAQILQQASATLLATANQAPSIALNLI